MAYEVLHCTVAEARQRVTSGELTRILGYWRLKSLENLERYGDGRGKPAPFDWAGWFAADDAVSSGQAEA